MNSESRKYARLAYRDLTALSRATMLESRRRFRLATMQGLRKPFTGAYYWMPLPDSNWKLMAFANDFYPDEADHIRIWREVVAIMARCWDRDPDYLARQLNDYPYGLPRGRVAKMASGCFAIYHGNDNPDGTDLRAINPVFKLSGGNTVINMDDHEHVIPEQVNLVRKALNASFVIAEPPDSFAGEMDGADGDNWT